MEPLKYGLLKQALLCHQSLLEGNKVLRVQMK